MMKKTLVIMCGLLICDVVSKTLELTRLQLQKQDSMCTENERQSRILSKMDLVNIYDLQYIGTLYFGENREAFLFILDTGSSVMWVPGIDCVNQCHTSHVYDFRSSSTAKIYPNDQETINYGKGSCSGIGGDELLSIQKDSPAFKVSLLFTFQDSDMEGMVANGVVGLSNSNSYENYLEQACLQGVIKSSVFAFELNKFENQFNRPSYFHYDDIPPDKIVDMIYVDVIDKDRWVVKLIGIYLGGEDVYQYSYKKALIDTGTSLLLLNPSLFNILIQKYITKVCVYQYREWICPCSPNTLNNSLPQLEFYVEGGVLLLHPEDYIIKQSNGFCTLGIATLNGYDFGIFGDALFRKYFILFDKAENQIGFSGVEVRLENVRIFTFIIIFSIISGLSILFLIQLAIILLKANRTNNQQGNMRENNTYFTGRSIRIGGSLSNSLL